MIGATGRIIGINKSNTGSIGSVEYAASARIAGVVDTVVGSDSASSVVDVVVATDGVAGLSGGMIGVVDGFVGIFSLNGAVAMMHGAADIIKGDFFVIG